MGTQNRYNSGMSTHNLDYSIYITPQANIPGQERPGWAPFLIEAVDESDDDHVHIGFWGPDNLLENLVDSTRLTAWISEAILTDSSLEFFPFTRRSCSRPDRRLWGRFTFHRH